MRLRPPDPPLTDGVVLLRPFRSEDVPRIVEACRDPEIPRWTRVPDSYTEADGREFVRLSAEWWAEGSAATFAVTDSSSGDLVASIGLHGISEAKAEVGYWAAPWARGRGVASRALGLVSVWGLRELGLARIELLADVANVASQRVAEKAGFQREGVLRSYRELKGARPDYVVFSLLPQDLPAGQV
jgi:RimJ/RimL family protein N-acetyltransferase